MKKYCETLPETLIGLYETLNKRGFTQMTPSFTKSFTQESRPYAPEKP